MYPSTYIHGICFKDNIQKDEQLCTFLTFSIIQCRKVTLKFVFSTQPVFRPCSHHFFLHYTIINAILKMRCACCKIKFIPVINVCECYHYKIIFHFILFLLDILTNLPSVTKTLLSLLLLFLIASRSSSTLFLRKSLTNL